MKNLLRVFFAGKLAKVNVFGIVCISLASGFLMIEANRHLAMLFDEHIAAGSDNRALTAVFLTVFMFVAVFTMRLISEYMRQRLWWSGEGKFKSYFVNKLLRSEAKYFYDKQPPDIWASINLPTQEVARFFAGLASILVSSILMIFYGIVVFSIDFYAGLFSCLTIPIYLLLARTMGNKLTKMQGETMDMHRSLGVVSQEAIAGVLNIKAKNAYNFFVNRIMKVQYGITKNMRKINVLMQYTSSVSGIINIIAPIFILFGALQFSDDLNLNIGIVLVLYINIPLFISAFGSVFSGILSYRGSLPAINKLKELDSIPNEQNGDTKILSFESLATKNVKIRFGETKTVSIPDFKITKGERVMLLGESGVGKSSLYGVVMGFNPDYEGEITINDIDLKLIDKESLRNIFGIVFQHTPIPTLPLKESILLGIHKSDDEVLNVLNETNLMSISKDRNNEIIRDQTLSGGERSRIALAQSIVRDSEVLLMDETFSNVDESMETQIIKSILTDRQKTFICISHRTTNIDSFDRAIQF